MNDYLNYLFYANLMTNHFREDIIY